MKFIHLKVATLLTDVYGNALDSNFDSKGIMNTFNTHVIACFYQNKGDLCLLRTLDVHFLKMFFVSLYGMFI